MGAMFFRPHEARAVAPMGRSYGNCADPLVPTSRYFVGAPRGRDAGAQACGIKSIAPISRS